MIKHLKLDTEKSLLGSQFVGLKVQGQVGLVFDEGLLEDIIEKNARLNVKSIRFRHF